MIISEYQAKREELEKQMAEITERQTAHKLELSARHTVRLREIASKIGALKHQRAELNKTYEADKAFFRRKYKQEKEEVQRKMHLLRMEYLTVNGITPPKSSNTGAAQAAEPDTIS